MPERDKFSAVWVSHSSIGDFLKCPRAYFLNNIYRNPETGRKISLMSPPLALGQVVHNVLESLSVVPTKQRFNVSLVKKFDEAWRGVSGKLGGFSSLEQEQEYKKRGVNMLKHVMEDPGPLSQLAVKIGMKLPHFWLSESENIILCGKVDWLKYLPEKDSVCIIDFKTGKRREDSKSLQLPIYHLLVHHCQNRKVEEACYWYLEENKVSQQDLPSLDEAKEEILKIAKKIKLARQLERFVCPQKDGCYACRPLESVVRGEAQLVGVSEFRQDIYVLVEGGGEENGGMVL